SCHETHIGNIITTLAVVHRRPADRSYRSVIVVDREQVVRHLFFIFSYMRGGVASVDFFFPIRLEEGSLESLVCCRPRTGRCDGSHRAAVPAGNTGGQCAQGGAGPLRSHPL